MHTNALRLETARSPLLAMRLAKHRLPRKGEELKWADSPAAQTVQDAIYQAIGELPDRLLNVIIGRFGEDLTLEDYGERIGKSRERVRQLEARAIRKTRAYLLRQDLFLAVGDALEIVPVPGGPFDPDWVSVKEASRLTDLSVDHVRHLARTGRIEARRNPYKRNELQIPKASLEEYVLGSGPRGRPRRGVWKEGEPRCTK